MASTRDIKRRIKGINSTMQITKAMELVSSSKLRKARENLEKSRPFYNTVYNNIRETLSYTSNLKHPYLNKREVKKSLYIVVTADRGLAGGFNSNIIRKVESEIKDKKENVALILVGVKAKDYFTRRGYKVLGDFTRMTEEPSFHDAKTIGDMALNAYEEAKVDEVKIVYTEFVSTINQEVKEVKLLPSESFEEEKEKKLVVVDFEPSPEEVLDYLIPKYIQSVIYGALIESASSQQAARRVAMENATENAEEMIDELDLLYNRARQAAITAELSEIVSGAKALK